MPYRLKLRITLEKPLSCDHPGVAVHGAIHRAIRVQDTGLAKMIHEAQVAPFSLALATATSKHKLAFTLNVLDEALTDVCLEALKVGTIIGRENESLIGFISSLTLTGKPYEAMIAELPSQPRRELVMMFLNCTALKSGKKTIATPRPDLIWNGLARRWQALSPYKLEGGYSAWFAFNLHCLRDDMTICRETLGKSTVKGFMGSAHYLISGDNEGAQVTLLLATFARYAGVGVKTGYGCGTVRVLQPRALYPTPSA